MDNFNYNNLGIHAGLGKEYSDGDKVKIKTGKYGSYYYMLIGEVKDVCFIVGGGQLVIVTVNNEWGEPVDLVLNRNEIEPIGGYTARIVCIYSELNTMFTVGKIYEIKHGLFSSDSGCRFKIKSFEGLTEMFGKKVKFIEIKE